jgi:PAS domain S-box-containing protein
MPSVQREMSGFQETETQFAILAESLPQLVWTTDPDGYHDYFNRRWYEFTGLDPDRSMGEGWTAIIHPDDIGRVLESWSHALSTGSPYEVEYRLRSAQQDYCWVLGRALPIRDLTGRIVRWFGTCTDINAQKKAEDALRRLDEQHRIALEAAGLGTWNYDIATGLVTWDERACALFGLPTGRFRSVPFAKGYKQVHPDDRASLQEYVDSAIAAQTSGLYAVEYRVIWPNGTIRWLRSNGQVFFSGEGSERRAVRLSGVCSDVTEQRAAKEAQQLLTSELNHRVKNLFAIASGLVSMTARTAKDPKEMAAALRGRLGALSRAHELVRPAPFYDNAAAGSATGLGQLIEAIAAPYRQDGDHRITIEGPEVQIGANAMTSLALVVHELTTNAAKYGCLSNAEGVLTIRWTLNDDAVALNWTESSGPAIGSAPVFEGFGTMLSQRTVTGQLGGTLTQEWLSEGLTVRMILPLDRLQN